jgi:hypothetical protein
MEGGQHCTHMCVCVCLGEKKRKMLVSGKKVFFLVRNRKHENTKESNEQSNHPKTHRAHTRSF